MAFVAKIQSLSRFIQANPALADVPFGTVAGSPITPRQALAMLQRGQAVNEVLSALATAGLDPPETEWELAEAYYRSLLAGPRPRPSVYVIAEGAVVGQELSIEEALEHIRRRDAKGRALLQSYMALKREMARRMR